MPERRAPTIRYRMQAKDHPPAIGAIVMGSGPRVRRAYRVLSAARCKGIPALGIATYRLQVEPMSATRGREEIAAGVPWWGIEWDRRGPRRRMNA